MGHLNSKSVSNLSNYWSSGEHDPDKQIYHSTSEPWPKPPSQVEGEVHVHENEFDEATDVGAEAGLGQGVEAELNERLPLLQRLRSTDGYVTKTRNNKSAAKNWIEDQQKR